MVYRSSNSEDTMNYAFIKQLELVTKECSKNKEKLIIMGYFNLPEVVWNTESCNKPHDHVASNFIAFLKVNNMCQFIDRTIGVREGVLGGPLLVPLFRAV